MVNVEWSHLHSTFNIQHSSFSSVSDLEHDLPKRFPPLQHPMPFRNLFQRQHPIDHGPKPSRLDVSHDLVHLGQATHGRSEDGEELEEDEADVDGGFGAGRGAAGDEAAAAGEGFERALEGLAADVLEDDVDT